MIELKPCPFCGSAARLNYFETGHGREIYQVICTNEVCKAATPHEEEKLAAVAVWNRRIYSEDGVNCSECEHFHDFGNGYGECNKFGHHGTVMRPSDFCSYARKRGKVPLTEYDDHNVSGLLEE